MQCSKYPLAFIALIRTNGFRAIEGRKELVRVNRRSEWTENQVLQHGRK